MQLPIAGALPRLAFGAIAGAVLATGLFATGTSAIAAVHARIPTATPTPQPYPFANGVSDVLPFTQTLTVAYPNATPVATTITGTLTDADTCPVTFNGISNICQDYEAYTDGSGGPLYGGYIGNPSGSSSLVFYGAVNLYFNPPYVGNYTQFWGPYQTYAIFPLTVGQQFNGAGYTDTEFLSETGPHKYSDTGSGVTNVDGSYSFSEKTLDPAEHYSSDEIQKVNSDGSASLVLSQTGYNKLTRTFGKPVVKNGQTVIPVTTAGGNALPGPKNPPSTTYVPDWFPGGGAAPSPLQNAPTTYLGTVTVPSVCGQYAGTQAGQQQELYFSLDPLAGYYGVAEYDIYFVNGVGDVCDVQSYTDTYYDNLVTGQLLYTVSDSTVLVLQDRYVPGGMARTKPGWPVALPTLLPQRRPTTTLDGLAHVRSGLHRTSPRASTLGRRFAEMRSIAQGG